jgi:hypothetical protein
MPCRFGFARDHSAATRHRLANVGADPRADVIFKGGAAKVIARAKLGDRETVFMLKRGKIDAGRGAITPDHADLVTGPNDLDQRHAGVQSPLAVAAPLGWGFTGARLIDCSSLGLAIRRARSDRASLVAYTKAVRNCVYSPLGASNTMQIWRLFSVSRTAAV